MGIYPHDEGVPLHHFLLEQGIIPSLIHSCSYDYTDSPDFVPHPNPQKVGNRESFFEKMFAF